MPINVPYSIITAAATAVICCMYSSTPLKKKNLIKNTIDITPVNAEMQSKIVPSVFLSFFVCSAICLFYQISAILSSAAFTRFHGSTAVLFIAMSVSAKIFNTFGAFDWRSSSFLQACVVISPIN